MIHRRLGQEACTGGGGEFTKINYLCIIAVYKDNTIESLPALPTLLW